MSRGSAGSGWGYEPSRMPSPTGSMASGGSRWSAGLFARSMPAEEPEEFAANRRKEQATIGSVSGALAGIDPAGRRPSKVKPYDGAASQLFSAEPAKIVTLIQAGGHPAVRVFNEPVVGAPIVGLIPNGEQAECMVEGESYHLVRTAHVQGWVGRKNVRGELGAERDSFRFV